MEPGRKSKTTGAYEANKFCLLNIGSAVRQFGGAPSATESGFNGGHKRNSPKESKKKARPAGRSAAAAPAGSQEKNIHPDFDIY